MSGSVSGTPPIRPVRAAGNTLRPPDQSPPPLRVRAEQNAGPGVEVDISRQVHFLLKEEGLQSLRQERERDETRSLRRDDLLAPPPPEEALSSPPPQIAAFAEGFVQLYHAQHPHLTQDEARQEVLDIFRTRGAATPDPPPPPERPADRRDATRRIHAHQLDPPTRGQRLTRSV